MTLTATSEESASPERMQAVYETVACGILVRQADGRISHANRAAAEMFELTPDENGGWDGELTEGRIVGPDGAVLVRDAYPALRVLRTGEPVHDQTIGVVQLNGHTRWLRVDAVPYAAGDQGGPQVVSSFIDITARKSTEEALKHQTLHDGLTGLPNRMLLRDRLEQAILATRRSSSPLALLFLDLDRFKEVNDTLGHHTGDLLLREVGPRLRGALRASDTVARLGGDEFAVVLPGADPEGAAVTALKLRNALEQPFSVDGHRLTAAGSIGIALYPDHGEDAETLMRRADIAMYVAKRTGAGQAVYAVDQDEHNPVRVAFTAELRQAIEREQLCLHYQPVVRLADGALTHVEALVRWQHPRQGLLTSDRFLPLAEQTGLIVPLTRLAAAMALRQCALWRDAGLALDVAIYLSDRALHDPFLPATLAALLHEYGVPGASLRLEFTENALMVEPRGALRMVTELHDLGIRLAIDAFGTGYSSLAALQQLPIDALKIDRSFVQALRTAETNAVIVRSAIDLAHNLGLVAAADGVEDRETRERLAALGCDLGQGSCLGQPMPADDLDRWLQTRHAAESRPAILHTIDTASTLAAG